MVFFVGALVSKLRVKELFLDIFFLSSIYRSIPVGTGNSNSIAEGRF